MPAIQINVAQLRWLHENVANMRAEIEANYSDYLDTSGKPVSETPNTELGRKICVLWNDRYRLPAIAKEMCPRKLDFPSVHFPLPTRRQAEGIPRPAPGSKIELDSDGNPKPQKLIYPKLEETSNPMKQFQSEPTHYGSNYELAIMRNFQQSEWGQGVGLRELSFLSMMYRREEDESEEEKTEEEKSEKEESKREEEESKEEKSEEVTEEEINTKGGADRESDTK